MGTVDCKNHFPGYHSMSNNLNDGSKIGRPRCYEDRAQSGQFCDGFLPRPLDGFLDHDREALKQTMLRHNAIFMNQVSELHRLYRRQRDLMEELKKNRDRSIFFPQRPSPGAKDSENAMIGPTHSSSPSLRKGGSPQVNGRPDSRAGKPLRRMLDLELPAEAYIDIEDAEDTKVETFVQPLSEPGDSRERNSDSRPESCLRLTLATSQRPPCLGDLNEPLGEEALEEGAASSRKFPFQANYYQDLQGKPRSIESSSGLGGRPFLRDDFGQSSSHANPLALGEVSKNAGPPSDPVAVGPTDARDFSWLREKPSQGMEPSDRISHFSNLPYPGFSGPTASSNPLSTLPGVDFAKATSLAALPWRQPLTGLGPVNAFPPFNRSTPSVGSEAHLYSNVFHHGSSSSSMPWSLIGDDHHKKSTLVNDSGSSCENLQRRLDAAPSGEGKKGSPPGGIPWLGTGGSRCNRSVGCSEDGSRELTFAGRHCRPKSNLCTSEVETLQHSPPVLKGKGEEFWRGAALNIAAAGSPEEISSDKDVVIIADSSSSHRKLQQKLFQATVDPSRGEINLNSSASSFVLVVDLEAPPASPAEEDPEPVSQVNRRLQSAEPEEEDPEKAAAAETILKIRLDGAGRWTEPPSPAATLRWFAEVAACDGTRGETMEEEAAGLEGDDDRGSSPSDVGGMDYFERTALNLTETRFGENFSATPMKGAEAEEEEEGDDDDEEEGFAHLLLTRKRGGQSRRRRRRRDFQRDILPGLVSLSRQEVTEDLQMIGGPMRRKGGRRQGGKGRQSLTAEASGGDGGAAATANLGQPGEEEAVVSGRRTVPGWGRTTKRCRRQRCPPVNGFPPSYS